MSSRSRSKRRPAPRHAPKLAVRRAVRADAGAIAALAQRLNEHQRDPVRYFTKEALLRDGFGRQPQFIVFLAEHAGRAVGYALLVGSYETGWAERGLYLQDLYVSAEARRLGAGRALVAAAAHEARRRGGAYVWCTAKTWNRPAHRFYRATGALEEKVVAYAWMRGGFARLAHEGAARATSARAPSGRRKGRA